MTKTSETKISKTPTNSNLVAKVGIIYSSLCKTTGKRYIGKTTDFNKRIRWHKRDAEDGCCVIFHRAIRKYGWEAFEWSIIWEDDDSDDDWMDWWERRFIKKLGTKTPNGYNMTDGGWGLCNPCQETRDKIRKAQKENFKNPEARKRMAEARRGIKHTEETKRRMSRDKLGTKASAEAKVNMSKAQKGRTFSEESKRKMSESAKKRASTIEGRVLLGKAMKGKRHTAKTKEKIRNALVGIPRSDEVKRKISMGRRGGVPCKRGMSTEIQSKETSNETVVVK